MSPRKRSVTMTDVAAYAGVSMKTVSNVINGWPYVTDETRQKVLDAISAVGYRPNRMARSLVTGETRTIGVVVPDVSNLFFGAVIRGCEDRLYEHGYSIFLCNTSEDVERERYYLDQLLSRGVDGLILWGTRICCSELEEIVGHTLPLITVELGEEPTGSNHTCINVDDQGGAFAATTHLLAEGYRRIAHLAGPMDRVTSERRLLGYTQALAAAGVTPPGDWIISDRPSVQGGFHAAQRLIEEAQPDAIFCYNDLMALGVLLAARHLGLQVPEDLAVAGFDDIETASMVEPPLTTVRIPQYKLGRLTGEVLLARLQGDEPVEKSILVPVDLQIRGSSSRRLLTEEQRQTTLERLVASFSAEARQSLLSDHPVADTPAQEE